MKKFLCGPVEIPEFVLQSMNHSSISHRSPEYEEIQKEVEKSMKQVFGTNQSVMTVTSSGTGSMESALINCFSPGDRILIPIIGNFCKQYSTMAKEYGLDVIEIPFEYGESADPKIVAEYMTEDTKGLFVIHNESSSGVMNDLEAFGNLTKNSKALLIVDSVSGAGGLPLKMDEWGIDIVITSSQKCLMAPAGLSFISLSDKAWQACESGGFPRYYLDLRRFKDFNQKNQTPTTPGIYNLIAVNSSLLYMRNEGFENIIKKTAENASVLRNGLSELGLKLAAKETALPSDTLTTVYSAGNSMSWVKELKQKGFLVAGGLEPYKKDTFRIGTMGYVFKKDIEELLEAIKEIQDEKLF